MKDYANIKSQLDALKVKTYEKIFYEKVIKDEKIIPKVTPFKGINIDTLLIKENKILFIKFMDTSEDLFLLLEEELLEVMYDEYLLLESKIDKHFKNISYNYIFVMPNVDIYNNYEFDDFIYNNIVDKKGLADIIEGKKSIDFYLKNKNNDIDLNMFLFNICPEYYFLTNKQIFNNDFKKINFYSEDYNYNANILDKKQIIDIASINYNNTVFEGGCGVGKTTTMISKAIKLSRIYPHHKFLILTDTKQKCNQLREYLSILYNENNNVGVYTYSSFIIMLAKRFNLLLDYRILNKYYDKTIKNLTKQAKNLIKNKNIFKGIFIDNIENFSSYEVDFIREFLYKNKFIFNVFYSKCKDMSSNLNIFKSISYDDFEKVILDRNYRQSYEVANFLERFSRNSNQYIKKLRPDIENIFYEVDINQKENISVNIVNTDDFEEQIKSIIWEIEYLIKDKGFKESDICIIYPYNKRKLKNGKNIYFQYMLKKELENNNIKYIQSQDSLTNFTNKQALTISNLYNLGDLEYKACIICELEMLYNQTIDKSKQDYQISDFVGDLYKVYTSLSKASDFISIITTFDENTSDIIRLLKSSI